MSVLRLRDLALLVLGVAFLFPTDAGAQDGKIAFVDMKRAVSNCKGGKAARQALDELQTKKREELRPREEEYKRLEEEFETQRFVLSEQALEDRRIELRRRQRELERVLTDAQEEMLIEERRLLNPILNEIRQAVNDVAKEHGYSLVLERTIPAVLFSSDSLDITDLVIERLNEPS